MYPEKSISNSPKSFLYPTKSGTPRGDPVLQGADEDSWARAVDLEAFYYGDRTALSGMAAETLTSSRTCAPTSCCTTVIKFECA